MDGGVESDHLAGGVVAGFVGVEAAVDLVAASDQSLEPTWIGSRAGSRDTDAIGIHGGAAEGVDGRLAENDAARSRDADPEVT